MINFDKTPKDTVMALSQNFPRSFAVDSVDWEAVGLALGALAIRQARLGLTSGEMAYLLMMYTQPEGSVVVDNQNDRITPNLTADDIMASLHDKGLVVGEYFDAENKDILTHYQAHLTDLGLAVCEWLLQTFGYSGQSTTYTPNEIIEELNTISK